MMKLEHTITTLEIAEMIGWKHDKVLRKIDRFFELAEKNNDNDTISGLVKLFTKDTYQDAKGETRKMYRATKKGCELFGNKMKDIAGLQFSMKYIERFNAMEIALKEQDVPSYMIEDPKKRAMKWIEEYEEKEKLEAENKQLAETITVQQPKVEYHDKVLSKENTVVVTDIAKTCGMRSAQQLNKFLRKYHVQYKQGTHWVVCSNFMWLIDLGYAKQLPTEFEDQLRWTEKGRAWIKNLVDAHNTEDYARLEVLLKKPKNNQLKLTLV